MPRWIRFTLWGIGCALIAGICTQVQLGGNLAALLPHGDSQLGREVRFFATQRATNMLAFEAWPADGSDDTAPAVRELQHLAASLSDHGLQLVGNNDPAAFATLEQVLYEHLPQLCDVSIWPKIAERCTKAGLTAHLQALRERANNPTDTFATTAAQGDILGLAGEVLIPLRDHLGSAAAHDGIIHHQDGRHVLLLGQVDFPPDDAERTAALMAAIDQFVSAAATRQVRIETIGSHRHFRDNFEGIRHDLLTSLPIGMIAIAIVLWTLVRSIPALLALHLPAVLAAGGAVALLHLCGRPVPLLLLGFAAGFLGVSIENALHMTVARQTGHEAHVRRPLLISYVTTAVAFAVLLASQITALQSLGIMVMGGLIIALAASLYLLPDLIRPQPQRVVWPHATAVMHAVTRLTPTWRLVILVTISALCLPGLLRVTVLSDLRAMDGSRPETKYALEQFLQRWDRFETSDFLVANGDSFTAASSAFTAARAVIGGPPTLVDILLPDPATQQQRLAAWNTFWQQHGDEFTHNLQSQLPARGYAATALCRERYQPRATVAPITSDTWSGTPFSTVVDQLITIDRDDQGHPTSVRFAAPLVHTDIPGSVDNAALAIEEMPHVWIASRRHMATDLVELVRNDLTRLSGWMALAMVLLVWIMERRLRTVIAVLAPPALSIAWCFGLLGWMGIPLSPFSVMVAAFVAGIGLDNAVFLAKAEHRTQALAPVLACTITTILGVGSLILAENPLLRDNGISLSIGLIACLISSLLLTPLIMDRNTTAE